jgi:hypothetical protein
MPATKWCQRTQEQRDLAAEEAQRADRLERETRRCCEPPTRDRLGELLKDLVTLVNVHDMQEVVLSSTIVTGASFNRSPVVENSTHRPSAAGEHRTITFSL